MFPPLHVLHAAHRGGSEAKRRQFLFGTLVLLALVGVLMLLSDLLFRVRSDRLAAPFQKDLQAYVALARELPPQQQRLQDVISQPDLPPPRGVTGKVGKMVVVNLNETRIDDLHFALPDALRASKPEEVGTVVLMEWGRKKVFPRNRFEQLADPSLNGRDQMIGQVQVFDWERKSLLDWGAFYGSVGGGKPDAEVLKYLRDLPGRTGPPPAVLPMILIIGFCALFTLGVVALYFNARKQRKALK